MKHFNPTITEYYNRFLKTKSLDSVNEVEETIVPTLNFNPFQNIVRSSNSTATATIYTTPTDKDFFLNACSLSMSNEQASGTGREQYIAITIDGSERYVLCNANQNSSAQDSSNSNSLSGLNIKADRGTNIRVVIAGTPNYATATIIGFTTETLI